MIELRQHKTRTFQEKGSFFSSDSLEGQGHHIPSSPTQDSDPQTFLQPLHHSQQAIASPTPKKKNIEPPSRSFD